jgi:secondary thiamine-phosphate synthase enzyme
MVKTGAIELGTKGFCDIQDITRQVEKQIRESEISSGLVTVFVPGATGAVTTIEYEDGLAKDFSDFWERLLPQEAQYQHDKRWGDGNGFSHIRAALLGPSLTIPFVEGKMTLGTWQQIIFVDFDNRSRSRKIICQVMGE